MNNRMDKYEGSVGVKARTKKNEKLYDEISDVNIDYIDIDVDNSTLIDGNLKPKTRSDYQKLKELDEIMPMKRTKEKILEKVEKEERVYDINEILKLAKDNKLFNTEERKRLINTEYNILAKLDLDAIKQEELSKDNLRDMIDEIYANENKKNKKIEQRDERDLFSDLKDTTGIGEKTNEEDLLNSMILDDETEEVFEEEKDFTTTTLVNVDTKEITNTEDEEDEDLVEVGKSKGFIIALVIIILVLLGVGGYFLYQYFVY